jgi:ABC-type Na+ efflux pump permease subunit
MMNDQDLDTLLSRPLPDLDAGTFSVLLMEKISRDQARPARILAWCTTGLLTLVIAAACLFGASIAARTFAGMQSMIIPATLSLLTLVLSLAVLRSAQE